MDLALIQDRWALLLSADQQEFVQNYLVTHSAKMASEMMGMAPSKGRRYLQSPTIQAAIKMAQKSLREGVQVTPEEVITDLRMLRDMALGRIPVPQTKWVDGEPVTKYIRDFNPNAANKAVENLGRVIGSFTDKKEISVPASDNQLARRLSDLLGVDFSDAVDGEYSAHTADHDPTLPTDIADEIDALAVPDSLSAAFEQLADDELTSILAAACDEQGVPKG